MEATATGVARTVHAGIPKRTASAARIPRASAVAAPHVTVVGAPAPVRIATGNAAKGSTKRAPLSTTIVASAAGEPSASYAFRAKPRQLARKPAYMRHVATPLPSKS